MKRLLLTVGIVFSLLLASAVALPFLVDSNRFRPMLEGELSRALDREVRLGNLKLALFRGSVTADDLSIADDPAYSKSPFVKAKSLSVSVEIWPLLKSRKLNVTGLAIDHPVISLIQSPAGEWNFSSLGGKQKASPAPPSTPASTSAPIDLSVTLIRITDGEFSLASTERRSRPLVLRDAEIEVRDYSAISEFPYSLKAAVAGGGRISLAGRAGPINPMDTAATPLSASLNVASLDLAGSGVTQSTPAIAGIVNIDGELRSDGKLARIEGKIRGDKLKLARNGTPAQKPVELNFAVDHQLRKHAGALKRGAIHIGAAPSSLTGTYAESGGATVLHLVFDGPKMAIDELANLLPALGVVLPRGSSLQGGTASAHIAIDGPADHLVTAGSVSLDNTRLANFDLGKKLAFVEALAGIQAGSSTDIQTLGATVRYAPEGGRLDDLKLVVPSIGNLEGAGTVSPANELALQMRATVKNMAVPFLIQGTTADPAFHPDVKNIAKEQAVRALGSEKVKGLLKGILGK